LRDDHILPGGCWQLIEEHMSQPEQFDIGNVGINHEDIESRPPACRGLVLREDIISPPANWRARGCMDRSRSTSVGARALGAMSPPQQCARRAK
jgi:hypothetical protein